MNGWRKIVSEDEEMSLSELTEEVKRLSHQMDYLAQTTYERQARPITAGYEARQKS